MKYVRNQKGFTLVELLATIVILGILIAIAVPAIGSMLEKSSASADESSIALMEKAGENAYVDDQIDFDGPEPESYTIPKLIEEGYLKLDDDHKFNQPENYVTKKNIGGEFIWMGDGNGAVDAASPDYGSVDVTLSCEVAESQGYICIYTPEELDAMRDGLSEKYILMNDIQLADFGVWTPIGTASDGFTGELNGNGFEIAGLILDLPDGDWVSDYDEENVSGLFGYVNSGLVQNLTLTDYTQVVGNKVFAGALVGKWDSTKALNPEGSALTLRNIAVSGNATYQEISGSYSSYDGFVTFLLGGGFSAGGDLVIEDIGVTGSLKTVSTHTSNETLGGLVGYVTINGETGDPGVKVTLEDIDVTDVDVTSRGNAAGLMHQFDGDHYDVSIGVPVSLDISNVVVSGELAADEAITGGLLGYTAYQTWSSLSIADYAMNATITGLSDEGNRMSGLIGDYYYDGEETLFEQGEVVLENIEIAGPMVVTDESANSSAYVAGVIENIWDGFIGSNMTVRNILVSSDMKGNEVTDVSGVIGNYTAGTALSADELPDLQALHAFEDVRVTGDMTGRYVAGFSETSCASDHVRDTLIDGFVVSGIMTATETASGLVSTYCDGSELDVSQVVKNVTIASDMTADVSVAGLIHGFEPYASDDTGNVYNQTFENINVTGHLQAPSVAGVVHDYYPYSGVQNITFTDVDVTGKMTGDEVAGFAVYMAEYESDVHPQRFVLDGFTLAAEMNAGVRASGLFGVFNYDAAYDRYVNDSWYQDRYSTFEAYYTRGGARFGTLDYSFKNLDISGPVAIENGESGAYGGLIGKYYTERRGNEYLFQDVRVTSDVTVQNENVASFKRGLIADPDVDGIGSLIFNNVQ